MNPRPLAWAVLASAVTLAGSGIVPCRAEGSGAARARASAAFADPGIESVAGVVRRSFALVRVRDSGNAAVCRPRFHDVLVDDETGREVVLELRRGSATSDALRDGHRYLIVATRRDPLGAYDPADVAAPARRRTIRGPDILAIWEI